MKPSSSLIRFSGIFKEAKQSGLHVTIHAGEWGPAENVRDAIENLGAERIGHGVRVLEDESVRRLRGNAKRFLKFA
jgi:adenosine deaminase